MRIKNVSSAIIKIPDLNINLPVGEVCDLKDFDPKLLHQHKRLNALFDGALLVNLGHSSIPGTSNALNSARDRISSLNFGKDAVIKKAPKNNRASISAVITKSDRRASISNQSQQSEQRYLQEHYTNMNPDNPNPIPPKYAKPQIQIDETFYAQHLPPDGSVISTSTFGENGIIESGLLFDDPAINHLPENTVLITDKDGFEFHVDLELAATRINQRCLGYKKDGSSCRKYSLNGFASCEQHLTTAEREIYQEIKLKNGTPKKKKKKKKIKSKPLKKRI